ncbi:hypothetical protein [Hymenobacter sp. 102]|uniref:hypothetical protein n=1 Tax=Hymenobacter sp. 102 TaxID=3403152 RepID=UPI003CE96CB5
MTVSHRAADASAATASAPKPVKVARVACCCKLADLLPLVQQMHQDTVQRPAKAGGQSSEAA